MCAHQGVRKVSFVVKTLNMHSLKNMIIKLKSENAGEGFDVSCSYIKRSHDVLQDI